jgi:hypothetical protein
MLDSGRQDEKNPCLCEIPVVQQKGGMHIRTKNEEFFGSK